MIQKNMFVAYVCPELDCENQMSAYQKTHFGICLECHAGTGRIYDLERDAENNLLRVDNELAFSRLDKMLKELQDWTS